MYLPRGNLFKMYKSNIEIINVQKVIIGIENNGLKDKASNPILSNNPIIKTCIR